MTGRENNILDSAGWVVFIGGVHKGKIGWLDDNHQDKCIVYVERGYNQFYYVNPKHLVLVEQESLPEDRLLKLIDDNHFLKALVKMKEIILGKAGNN